MAATAPVHQLREWIRDPIFILGCHKSGTSLLRGLLDGHPDLYVYPHEIHFFHSAGYGIEYGLRRSPPREMSHGEMVEKMAHELLRQNLGRDSRTDATGFGSYGVQSFSELMLHASYDSPRDLFELFHGALYQALEGAWPQTRIRVVEKSVENAEYAAVLATMYPKARFIHMVRNPYATMEAMRRMKGNARTYPYMGPMAQSLHSSIHYLFRNRKTLPHYQVLCYEDLARDPERVMRRVATFLGIPFVETMVDPVHKEHRGDSSSGKGLIGIKSDALDRWKSEIHPFEVHLTNAVAKPMFDFKMYEQESATKGAATPIRGEWPRTYLANRLLLRFGV